MKPRKPQLRQLNDPLLNGNRIRSGSVFAKSRMDCRRPIFLTSHLSFDRSVKVPRASRLQLDRLSASSFSPRSVSTLFSNPRVASPALLEFSRLAAKIRMIGPDRADCTIINCQSRFSRRCSQERSRQRLMIVDFTRRCTCQRNSRIVRRNARPADIFSRDFSETPLSSRADSHE